MNENVSQGILAVIIAHNELEYVRINIQILLEELKDTASEIVVVDNYSDDGLREWLSTQDKVSYIICDDKPEGYGQILEVARKQFGNGRDILLLRANYFVTPGSIALLHEALHSKKEIAAVGPVGNYFTGEQKEFVGDSYGDAVSMRGVVAQEIIETVYLDLDAMLIKADAAKYLPDDVAIPPAVMRGWMKRVLREGCCLAVVKQALCYVACKTNDEFYRMFDAELYRREKLHQLLYSFGDIAYQGVYLYKYLEPDIMAGINKEHGLQDNVRNKGFVEWKADEPMLSTEEEAEEVRQIVEHLPQKDVLFATLPLRREYQGAYVHTAVEGYMSSLDEEQYLDLELTIKKDGLEYIPTKNRYPILGSTIPAIYEVGETDRQELLQFLWTNFIRPLEETLGTEFPKENLRYCMFKASYILKQRVAFMKFYRDVIGRVKPKVIVYAHGQDFSLTFLRDTALELGIPTLEIHHGVEAENTYHKNLVYADHLMAFSEIEVSKSREQGNDRVLAIGKPGVYDNVPEPEYKYPVIVISFISSMEKEIWPYALNLARRLDRQKFQVVYKMHNVERWSEEEERQVEETENLHLLPGFLDIRGVIELSDIVVGIRSSGIFDALVYPKVKVIAIRDKVEDFCEARPRDILQAVADTGDIVMVENEEELYQEILNYKRNVMYRGRINNFWIADAEERFRKLVDSYLRTK